jgi:hypothetical protein
VWEMEETATTLPISTREPFFGDATCLEVSDSLRDRYQLRTIAHVAGMNPPAIVFQLVRKGFNAATVLQPATGRTIRASGTRRRAWARATRDDSLRVRSPDCNAPGVARLRESS